MPGSGPVNSPIDDSAPLAPPQTKPVKDKPTDFERLARDSEYPQIQEWMQQQKEYYQRYLPGGVPAETVPEGERAQGWASAVVIIKFIETFQRTIEAHSQKRR